MTVLAFRWCTKKKAKHVTEDVLRRCPGMPFGASVDGNKEKKEGNAGGLGTSIEALDLAKGILCV